MARAKDPRDKIIDAALALAADRPWSQVGLGDIAKKAKLPLGTMRDTFGSKTAILAGLMRRVDRKVLDEADPAILESEPRDRLFDLLMQRIEALAPHKAALKSILPDLERDPGAWLRLGAASLASQRWMLTAAGIDTSGPAGRLRVRGLAFVYGSVLRVWLRDDDPGMAKTMSELDRQLRRGESLLGRLEGPMRLAGSLLAVARSAFLRRQSPGSGSA